MARLKKFSIAESGTLVYRTNGKAYRGEYSLKVSASGVINVYGKDGRRIGTVAAPTTKKGQREIERLDKRRRANAVNKDAVAKAKRAKAEYERRRIENRATREFTESSSGLESIMEEYSFVGRKWTPDFQSYLNVMKAYGDGGALAYRNYYGHLPKIEVIQSQNLAKWLEAMVNDGTYTVARANELFEAFQKAFENKDDIAADVIWYQVQKDARDHGRYDSDGDENQ